METVDKVLAHTCFQLESGAAPDKPLTPKKCRCREYISKKQAAAEVALGVAQYINIVDKILEIESVCPTCDQQDMLMKSCHQCSGTGRCLIKKAIIVPGVDIIRTVSLDGKRNTKTTQVKKSPTLEKAHLERAWVSNNKEEQERIELYGISQKEFIKSLISGYEPEDNIKTWTGRKYDFGRSI